MATKQAEPLSAKEAATELGTDARTLRKFLRKRSGLVGQGQRWLIDRKDLPTLKKEFDAWAQGAAAAKTASKGKAKAAPPPDDEIYDTEELEEFEDFTELEDPDSEELEDLELEELDG